MRADCACIAIIAMALPVREIAKLVSSYVPHRTDADVIRGRLAFGMREWEVKANDEFIPEKDRDHKTTFNITRQEVIFKIKMSDPKWSCGAAVYTVRFRGNMQSIPFPRV